MKHPATRAYYTVWNEKRGDAAAPDRSDLDPEAVRDLLGDIFVLACDAGAGYPFRVAGTRVCALLGCDAKGARFTELFARDSRRELRELLGIVAEETEPAVAGIAARGSDGRTLSLELLLLPFSARAHAPLSLTGLLVPLQEIAAKVGDFNLVSWRCIAPRPTDRPRSVRRWGTRGFFVYEGLR